jgi:prepilin-type N-terminal cleavage/methylation domain-containing protein
LEATVKKNQPGKFNRCSNRGFTLVEVMVSMAILTIGSLALLGVFGVAVAANQTSQQNMIARQLASEALESIFTARNTSQLSWAQIQNSSNGGIFTDGLLPVKCAGPDGIIGTVDDTSCTLPSGVTCPNGGVKCLVEPGADGIVGTADDVILSLNNYQRQIQMQSVLDTSGNVVQTLRTVTITIQYTTPNLAQRKYVLNEYVSSYR